MTPAHSCQSVYTCLSVHARSVCPELTSATGMQRVVLQVRGCAELQPKHLQLPVIRHATYGAYACGKLARSAACVASGSLGSFW